MGKGYSVHLTQYDIEEVQSQAGHKFSQKEIQGLYKRFRALDKHHKGYITADEFMNIPELALNPLAQRLVRVFENHNFTEFVRLLSAFSGRADREDKLRFAFEVFDVDGDGEVSREDLLHVLRIMTGSALSDAQLASLVTRAGVDRPLDAKAFLRVFDGAELASTMVVDVAIAD